jgi:TonB-linked SusC/RagA family outer membrane protein
MGPNKKPEVKVKLHRRHNLGLPENANANRTNSLHPKLTKSMKLYLSGHATGNKMFLIMKLTIGLLLIATFHVGAATYAQEITITKKTISLQQLFEVINQQTGYAFIYDKSLLENTRPVAASYNKTPLKEVLDNCLREQGLTYVLSNGMIIVKHPPILRNKAVETLAPDSSTLALIEIHGRVANEKGEALEGANVRVKGTSISTQTGQDGAFTIKAATNATLVISFIGFDTREMAVNDQSVVNVQLHVNNQSLGDIVIIGYGQQHKADVTSSVTTVKSEDFVTGPVSDAGELLKGKVAGLSVSNPSGDPNAQSQILLRGTNTLGGANTGVLVIVDGVPGDLLTVAPEDIAEISVLKDASATAIYGVNGTNGVIIITTKRSSGNIINQVDYNGNISTSQETRLPKLLTAQDYRDQIAAGTRLANYDLGHSTNWIKAMSNNFPVSNVQNLTFRGGNNQTSYLASLNYRDLNGVFQQNNHKQVTGRVDINHSMFDGKLKLNLGILQTNFNDLPFNQYDYEQALKMNPTAPVREPDGTYYQEPNNFEYQNPLSDIYNTSQPQNSYRSKYNATLTLSPVKGLRLAATGAYTKSGYLNKYFANFQNITTIRDQQNGVANISQGQNVSTYLNLSAEYSKGFGDHHFDILAGYEYQDNNNFFTAINNHDFPTDVFGYNAIYLGTAQSSGTNPQGLGNPTTQGYTQTNLISYFARATYNYKEKYLLLASLRIDGASQLYGASQPYGKFPSIQLGWRITKEKFMDDQRIFDDLKLRAGYGVTGNPPAGGFLGVGLLGYGNYILYNGEWIQTLGPSQNANPSLRWEQKHETNFGLDYSLLKGLLTGTIDVYDNKITGLLYNYTVPSPPNLYPTTVANVGTMENKGLEIAININPVRQKDFSWSSGITFSTNSNKLVSLSNQLYQTTVPYFTTGTTFDPIQTFTNIVQVGQPIGQFYGFKVTGVSATGTWIYQEPDGKTVPYASFNHSFADKQVLGNGLPKFYAGWNNSVRYKNWDFGVTMRGAFDFQVLDMQRMYFENTSVQNYNRLASAKNKLFGTAVLSPTMPEEFNSYYIENGAFWKIDNINLSYSFRNLNSKYIHNLRVYASTLNSFVFTGYRGTDPEVPLIGPTAAGQPYGAAGLAPGVDSRDTYPTTRTYTIGVSANF